MTDNEPKLVSSVWTLVAPKSLDNNGAVSVEIKADACERIMAGIDSFRESRSKAQLNDTSLSIETLRTPYF